jgi:hypothetical protein
MMEQNRALRSRLVVSEMRLGRLKGCYVRIGNSAGQIASTASQQLPGIGRYPRQTISFATAEKLAGYPTVLSQIEEDTFDQLVAHGYEATDSTLGSYHPSLFAFLPFN